jgi:N-acetyl sugar amidotransferase
MFNEQGVCSACTAFEAREKVDWIQREKEFRELCDRLISDKYQYHCVVPVSGGKDSTYQIIKAKEYGLNPLAVCAVTDDLSSLGRNNLNNISRIGVDVLELNTNNKIRRKINAYTLREIGDISWAEHVSIFTIPVRIAVLFSIPLIIWGENPQNEYGGPYKAQEVKKLDNRWLQEYGGLNGLRVADLIDQGIATKQELYQYIYPDLSHKTTNGIFLGKYFPWDGAENAVIAAQNGFKTWYGPVEGIGYDYENLDNHQTGVHDYQKYTKYAYGRATDLVSNHIRRGNITREEGKEIILENDGKWPRTYLGKPLEEILEPLEINIDEFIEIINKFTNKELFEVRKGKPPRALFKESLRNA